MPLTKSKSKNAFEHNVKAEMSAGKPLKQSLAIAYSVKRHAKKANGGMIQPERRDIDNGMVDKTNFLSDEEALESPFQDKEGPSDSQELAEMDLEPHNDSSNEKSNVSLQSIIDGIRKKHLRG